MSSRQGTRTIVVDGERYAWRGSWSYDLDGTRLIRLAAWQDGARGSPLQVCLVGGMFITPGEVAAAIAFARAHGWAPREGRSPYRLQPGGAFTLPGWRVSRPAPLERWAPEGPVFRVSLDGGAGAGLAAALQIERVADAPCEWENRAFLVRDEASRASAFTRSFADLLTLLGAAQGRVRHVDGLARRVPSQGIVLGSDEALRVTGSAPFPGARALGDRVWLRGAGEEAAIECITLQTNPPRVGTVWRWLTLTPTGIVDRRTR